MKGLNKRSILIGLLLFAVPFLMFGYFSYSELINKQELQLRKGYEHSVEYIQYNLDSAVHEVKHHLIFISKNPILQDILSGKIKNTTQIPLLLSNNVEPYIWYHITSTRSMMRNLTIYSKKPYNVGKFLRSEQDVLPFLPAAFQDVKYAGGLVSLNDKLCYVQRIYSAVPTQSLGLIICEVDVDKLLRNNIHEEKEIGFSAALADSLIRKRESSAYGPFITVQKVSEQTGLVFSLYIPSYQIKIETKSIVIAVLIGLVFLTTVYLLLMWRVQVLENQVEQEHNKWERMRLKALQAQMNPHFLYNTLSMINWKAKYSDTPEISKITTLISSFYRTALNRGRDDIRLQEELENTRNYLELKHIMMDGIFTYQIDCPENIADRRIVNFILQPIVENALVHGIAPNGEGHVSVVARQDGEDILISVIDNGAGMVQEQSLPQTKKDGYGIYNIDERIKLLCGQNYGVKIMPAEHGTHVLIRVKQPVS